MGRFYSPMLCVTDVIVTFSILFVTDVVVTCCLWLMLLSHIAHTVCSTPQLLQEEEEHLFRALTKCKYPTWAIKRARIRSQTLTTTKQEEPIKLAQKNKKNLYMVVPYHQGLSERIKRSCNKFGVQVFFKGGQTIRNLLMAPKDKDPITNKSGVIYRFKCSQHGCKEEYIGESARNFAERFKETPEGPFPYISPL